MFNRAAIYPAVAAPHLTAGAARLQAPSGARTVRLMPMLDSSNAGAQYLAFRKMSSQRYQRK
jgi:hypothetical protein